VDTLMAPHRDCVVARSNRTRHVYVRMKSTLISSEAA